MRLSTLVTELVVLIDDPAVVVTVRDAVCDADVEVVPVAGTEGVVDAVTSCDAEDVHEHFSAMTNVFITPPQGSPKSVFVAGTVH